MKKLKLAALTSALIPGLILSHSNALSQTVTEETFAEDAAERAAADGADNKDLVDTNDETGAKVMAGVPPVQALEGDDAVDTSNPAAEPVLDTAPVANPEAAMTAPAAEVPVAESDPALVDPATSTEPTAAPVMQEAPSVGLAPPEDPVIDAEARAAMAGVPAASESTKAILEGDEAETAMSETETESTDSEPIEPVATMPTSTDTVDAETAPTARVATAPAPPAPSASTQAVLQDDVAETRDRAAETQQAAAIEDDDDASKLIYSILGGAAAGALAAKVATKPRNNEVGGYPQYERLPARETGRTDLQRGESVNYLVDRFNGNVGYDVVPDVFYRYQTPSDEPTYRAPRYYDDNRRVVRYTSRDEIPAILLAQGQLNRLDVVEARNARYRAEPVANRDVYRNEVPEAYLTDGAYAVSYEVDPASAVSRDDILFRQGSTAFADAYSYDVVIDLAEAMNSTSLIRDNFIIEGHASSEGDFGKNLALSQERAERISRELVRYGVAPERLLPVGYGESEAAYPADAPESQRALDRRVMVFKMQ